MNRRKIIGAVCVVLDHLEANVLYFTFNVFELFVIIQLTCIWRSCYISASGSKGQMIETNNCPCSLLLGEAT